MLKLPLPPLQAVCSLNIAACFFFFFFPFLQEAKLCRDERAWLPSF